jgi:hypothetical protein
MEGRMPVYTITLTAVEQKAMEYISTDVDFWIQNAVHERARLAVEEMVRDQINDTMAKGEAISGTREEIVMNSKLLNAKARHEAAVKQMMDMPPAPHDQHRQS